MQAGGERGSGIITATRQAVWLVPAKKETTEPTSLMYDQALDEALCIQRRLVALRTLEFLTFWTYLANRGVWEALVGAGPTCTAPATTSTA